MNKQKIEKIILADIMVGDDGRIMNYEQAAIDIVYVIKQELKEEREKMAKALRMNKRRFPATNITVFYQELREEFNLTIDSYLKEK